MNVKSRSKLKFASGLYYVSSLTFEPQSELTIEGTDGPVVLYVSGDVTWRGVVKGTKVSERLIIAGTKASSINIDAPFLGSVFAPQASLRLGPVDGSGHEGSFYARTLEVLARNPIRFVPFAHWGYLFPPKITAECRNRAKPTHAAALFSWENPLDFPVKIPAGPENKLAATKVKSEPLTVFAPGKHTKDYWVEYGGPSVSWTLRGKRVDVPDTARHCVRSDWSLSSPRERTVAAGPEALALETQCRPPVCAPEMQRAAEAFPAVAPDQTPKPVDATRFKADFSQVLTKGTGTVLNATHYLGFIFSDDQPTFDLLRQGREWVIPRNDEYFETRLERNILVPPDRHGYFSMIMVEARDDVFSTTYNVKMAAVYSYDWATKEFNKFGIFKYPNLLEDFPLDSHCDSESSSNWEMCWALDTIVDVPPVPPRICATWNTQYVDGGFGEDDYVSTASFEEPASFALARLYSKTGKFASWTSPDILDSDGCVRQPTIPVVVTDVSDVGLELFGKVVHEATKTTIAIRENSDVTSSFKIDMTLTDETDSRGRVFVARSKALDELTRAGAIASKAARLQNEGRDLAFKGNTVAIEARSPEAELLGTDTEPGCGSAHAEGIALRLRPSRLTAVDNPGTPTFDESTCIGASDASLKDVWSHELGHAVQDAFPASVQGAGIYDFNRTFSDGTILESDGPMMPEECRCSQVQNEYLPWHCIQSLELNGAAQNEGYASAYGKLFYNRPDQADCMTAYVKWTLWPECVDGNTCFSIMGLSDAQYSQLAVTHGLRGLPDRSKLEGTGWVLIKPPFIFSCAVAQKWRNTACFDPTVADPELLDQFGNEMDWEQFFWALWAPGIDAGGGIGGGGVWTPALVNIGYQTMGAVDPNWGTWTTTVGTMVTSATVTDDQQSRFELLGRSRGVDNAPLP